MFMPDPTLIDHLTEPYLLSFFGWWQFVVCLFGFFALLAIWWHIGRRQNDFGQVWLALSVLCWSLSGVVEIRYGLEFQRSNSELQAALSQLAAGAAPSATDQLQRIQEIFPGVEADRKAWTLQLQGWRSILSLFNGFFILLALPWFRYIPARLEPIIQSRYWAFIVGLPFVFSLLPTISSMLSGKSALWVSELDVYYAALTLAFLGPVLWDSFAKRRLQFLAWLSVICTLIALVAQLYKLTDGTVNLTLFSAIFKTSLIMIFFALALSWVKELAENVIPAPENLFLSFHQQRTSPGKIDRWVSLRGFPGKAERRISLTPALYELMATFAQRREENGEGWLEIKPKGESRSGKSYDIQDYNEIKRLIVALLDGIFGKGNWAKNQHFEPFRNSFFEMSQKRERKIRLTLPARNISFV